MGESRQFMPASVVDSESRFGTGEINHKGPSAAQPQPNFGISLAKAQRRKGFKNKILLRTWRLCVLARGISEFEMFPIAEYSRVARKY